ncbi:DsbA family protein [Sandaracinobacteroides hominis]|uniref:DsbA family protein n=1 Tax=Sandaracinobacteroides hominis TaxID=2780086 RepID=UPI0018F322F7|nr:DsbA family protein [Sandaracinobacteroides hominis]
MGEVPTVHYFHGVSDPWSLLAVQMLPRLEAAHGVRIVPHLVPPPAEAAAPEPGLLADWGLRDAQQLATAHALQFPENPVRPSAKAVAAAEAQLAGAGRNAAEFAARAVALGTALFSGEAVDGAGDATAALAEGAAALTAAGHYLPGVFSFEGECYWGVDRLPHLEARLGGTPVVRQLEASAETGDSGGAELHFFLSLRSPYTHIAAPRVAALARRWNAKLVLRPVLPMVMRGLPVPREKRMYIVRDTKREAERLGLQFGRVCDPVGVGVERGMAVLHRAIAMGHGPAFAQSFLQGAFAEAVDATTDDGLRMLAVRAGLGEADVRAALADESWRPVAEANRAEMFAGGLWGVPSFRVGDLPSHWGQDRLWAVERDLRTRAGEVA